MQCDFLFPTPVWHGDIELNVDSLMAFAMPLMNPEPMEYGSYESTYVSASGYRNGKCVVAAMVDKIEEMANHVISIFSQAGSGVDECGGRIGILREGDVCGVS